MEGALEPQIGEQCSLETWQLGRRRHSEGVRGDARWLLVRRGHLGRGGLGVGLGRGSVACSSLEGTAVGLGAWVRARVGARAGVRVSKRLGFAQVMVRYSVIPVRSLYVG